MVGTRINYYQNKANNQNYTSSSQSLNTNRTFNLFLNGGYFLKDNIALGILIGYSNQFSENIEKSINSNSYENINNASTTIYSGGLYCRVYKMLAGNRIGFFGNLEALYSVGKSKSIYTNSSNGVIMIDQNGKGDITGYNVSLSPGVVFFITKSIGLEAAFGNLTFRSQTNESVSNSGATSTNTTNGLNFNFSASSFVLGINFYLSDKKD